MNHSFTANRVGIFLGASLIAVVCGSLANSADPSRVPQVPRFKNSPVAAPAPSGPAATPARKPAAPVNAMAPQSFQFRPEPGLPGQAKSGVERAAFNSAKLPLGGCRTCPPRPHVMRGPSGFKFSCEPDCVVGPGEGCESGTCREPAIGAGPGEPILEERCSPERDEFLCNGDDENENFEINRDWQFRGLDPQDAIAHYDTLDGRTLHTPSNKVCLYAPRFAVVRKLQGLESRVVQEKLGGFDQPYPYAVRDIRDPVASLKQPLRPQARLSIRDPQNIRDRQPGLTVINEKHLATMREGFLPHEDLLLIQKGVFEDSEKLRLAERINAALVWMEKQTVQLILDGKMAHEMRDESGVGVLVVYDTNHRPRLRLCKIASASEARSGEVVEFTLRFDNLGNEEIGNVTILDNLPARLEYVEESATCSLEANFSAEPNEAESVTLKWELKEPLKALEGGIVRFKARVR